MPVKLSPAGCQSAVTAAYPASYCHSPAACPAAGAAASHAYCWPGCATAKSAASVAGQGWSWVVGQLSTCRCTCAAAVAASFRTTTAQPPHSFCHCHPHALTCACTGIQLGAGTRHVLYTIARINTSTNPGALTSAAAAAQLSRDCVEALYMASSAMKEYTPCLQLCDTEMQAAWPAGKLQVHAETAAAAAHGSAVTDWQTPAAQTFFWTHPLLQD